MKKRIIKVIPGERFTPYALARKLNAKVILESSSFKKGKERYSVLLIKEAFKVCQTQNRILFTAQHKQYKIKANVRDILDVLLYFANQHPPLHQDIPFPAGGIGYLSYEFARHCDTIEFNSKKLTLNIPEAFFIFGHIFIIFDHYTDIIYIIGLNYKEASIDLEQEILNTEERINDLDFNYLSPQENNHTASRIDFRKDKENFIAGVHSIRKEIIAGNLLQGVLSRRIHVKTGISALEAYKKLRTTNPSPYLFYIEFGKFQLFGSSPEMHVKVKDGRAIIHPIAGTRKRGQTPQEDILLAEELQSDPKEQAEHLMLVDLARNDLSRFCIAGSVKVDQYMEIEKYSHVMHLVSHVSGNLMENKNGTHAIRATFPAGTVSGAPKIKAIEIIDDLETTPRNFYAGLIGYMEPGGNVDTCITIRSGLKKGDTLYLQAGAGIVFDSRPEREYEETCEKLQALALSVGVEV